MARDPAFLFYTGDFTTGTQFMSDEQVGKYIRLLMAQHQHGHLTENQMIMICKSYDNDVFSKFVKDDKGLFYNERLESEVNKRKGYCNSRSNNKSGRKKKEIIRKSYDSRMEDENRNEDNKEWYLVFAKKLFDENDVEGVAKKENLNYVLAQNKRPLITKEMVSEFHASMSLSEVTHKEFKEYLSHLRNYCMKKPQIKEQETNRYKKLN